MTRRSKKLFSWLLCLALLISYVPVTTATAAPRSVSPESIVTDPGTAHTWETMMGTPRDGNRYAGRVWVDKSVYKNGDTVLLNTRGEATSSFTAQLAEDEAFQIVFSALGSTMTTRKTVSSTGPLDVVLVLDTSTSMDDTSGNVTRLERVIRAANGLLEDLLTIPGVRIAIVTYNKDSETLLPLEERKNGIRLGVANYYNNGAANAGVVTAYDRDNKVLGKDSGYTQGTNLQAGIDRGFRILANATEVEGRVPVAIVLTDGQANRANQSSFYSGIGSGTGASDERLFLSTLLNAAYNKTLVEANYGREQTVYGIGVDLGNNATAHVLMNPGDSTNRGFNSKNTNSDIREAYTQFVSWSNGQTIGLGNGNSRWTFDHNYPNLSGAVTDSKIAANIHYVDTYFDVASADLEETFQMIYEELSSGAFNPISSGTTLSGGTGVENTPLIYVDTIGAYMEVKEIQAISLFGASYGVTRGSDGSYRVDAATGINPTTGESWDTTRDIRIDLTTQADGSQRLEVRINQEILPIILEQIISETIGGNTQATITEILHEPLRLFYTVGLADEILLPNGQLDISRLQGYSFVDDAEGTVSFYSNQFAVMNGYEADGSLLRGDAHVGFQPSPENRYYYHQANQGIFTAIRDKNGAAVTVPENSEYGIFWDADSYQLSWMTYGEYLAAEDTDKVYTYVTYYRPVSGSGDGAEEVTYLVYTDWGYLKESVGFYDNATGQYLQNGAAIDPAEAEAVVAAWGGNTAQLYAVLGIGSLRTSRLHNMTVDKSSNTTQTAMQRYSPEYTYETATLHNGNDVVVWLGNNGKLTMNIHTGIALSKQVTEPMGSEGDTYALTVTVPQEVTATPQVVDELGQDVTAQLSHWQDNVLTVQLKAGQTVYISGIPGGTQCLVSEQIPQGAEYYMVSQPQAVTVPTVSQAIGGSPQFIPVSVTNAPYEYGDLYITKEITGEHTLPAGMADQVFRVHVHFGQALAGQSFTLETQDPADPMGSLSSQITLDEQGNAVLEIRAAQTLKVLRLPAGTSVTLTEEDPGAHFSVSYQTRNHSGLAADSDNALVIPEGGSATAVIRNHYTPSPTGLEVSIAGTKEFIAEGSHEGGSFQFLLQKWNGSSWEDMNLASVTYAPNASGTQSFYMADVLAGITYTREGSHAYRVLEVPGDAENVTYDRSIYAFDVVVKDEGGQLVATATDAAGTPIGNQLQVTFRNTYHTAPVSIDIEKLVDNRSGEAISPAGFGFLAQQTDENWQPIGASMTVYSDAAGKARLTATYTQPGSYHYLLTEIAQSAPGWSYSAARYRITVTVTEEDGDLTATLTLEKTASLDGAEQASVDAQDASRATVSFRNVYDPQDASLDLDAAVIKQLTGKTLEAGAFTFYVIPDGTAAQVRAGTAAPILVGTNTQAGQVHFVDFEGQLLFTQAGKYRYDIMEVIPAGAALDHATGMYFHQGMYYDATIYDLVVEVRNDSATGTLQASYYFEDSVNQTVTYHNRYAPTRVSHAIGGQKLLHGRAPRSGEFTFRLYEGDTLLQTVTNQADGSFTFAPMEYIRPGVYSYRVEEVAGTLPGVSYEGAAKPVTVTVTVTDVGGRLQAEASPNKTGLYFENSYTAQPALVQLLGTKVLKGGALTDGSFTFRLYRTDSSFNLQTALLVDSVTNTDGGFQFARGLSNPGTYFFAVTEDSSAAAEGIVYDRTVHRFAVYVTDPGDGQLLASLIHLNIGRTTPAAPAVSAQLTFTNATFEEATEKSVYLNSDPVTQIDGRKVQPGDILTYTISYTNYTGEAVVASIVDNIPMHTTFVEGSASHGGTYVGTHISWILDVAKGQTVQVSFRVRVDEAQAVVTNTAHIRDGVNSYSTNEVRNHTIEEPLEKDVYYPEDLTMSIDGWKVYEGDTLLYSLRFINASSQPRALTVTDAIPENTGYVEGSADMGGVYADGVITWNLEQLAPWQSVTLTFRVTVNSGIGAATIPNQATATDGENSYTSRWVSNYTVEDEVTKNVFAADAPTVSIDGNAVNRGDTLVYAITYRNTAEEAAQVTITDRIPAHTAYVEGSADLGGVYADGSITWVLDVAAGQEVTVSFRVTVDNSATATLENQAAVEEGKNRYETNVVTNPVSVPEPMSPDTGDTTDLVLLFALLLASGTGIVGLILSVPRKKEEI